ncbi:hypothetical protein CRE_26192 [Caenorhabditis remanei]|nr:hypothetical protein CRE_26192 [Caenorhabditis remanei]
MTMPLDVHKPRK